MHHDDPIDFQIAELIGKYLRDEITSEELIILERWRSQDSRNLRVWQELNDKQYLAERLKAWPTDAQSAMLWSKMHGRTNRSVSRRRIWRIGAVAAVFLATVLYAIRWHDFADTPDVVDQTASEITPIKPHVIGGGAAIASSAGVVLITDEGEQIALEGEQIHSYQLEKLALKGNHRSLHHTIKTAVANTYQVELSDGTNVWLNAASSLRYPLAFEEKERKVFLTGEAYFDVAKDTNKPFTVITDKSYIRVLGTEFNVRSYPDEVEDKTSLFTGSVNVHGKSSGAISALTPGYEAIVSDVRDIAVRRMTASKVLAWKENLFIFENEPLGELMRELATWYGLTIHFEDPTSKAYRFTGRLKRYPTVDTLLDLISETSKVTYRMNGDQIWINSVEKKD